MLRYWGSRKRHILNKQRPDCIIQRPVQEPQEMKNLNMCCFCLRLHSLLAACYLQSCSLGFGILPFAAWLQNKPILALLRLTGWNKEVNGVFMPPHHFLHLPPQHFFPSTLNTRKLNISSISASGFKLFDTACMSAFFVVAFKVIADSKSQTASLLLHSSKKTTFINLDLWSSEAKLTHLFCSLCLILMCAGDVSLLLAVDQRVQWGRLTIKLKSFTQYILINHLAPFMDPLPKVKFKQQLALLLNFFMWKWNCKYTTGKFFTVTY